MFSGSHEGTCIKSHEGPLEEPPTCINLKEKSKLSVDFVNQPVGLAWKWAAACCLKELLFSRRVQSVQAKYHFTWNE
jgi:hypothetical protein